MNEAPNELAALGPELGADAALRVHSDPLSVELWTARPAGDPGGTYDELREQGSSPHEREVLVLRVVESLRALALSPAVPPPDPAPTAAAPQAPKPQPEPAHAPAPEPAPLALPQLWLSTAPALTLSPGGLPPQLGAALGVRVQPLAWASIAGFAYVPLYRDALQASEGRASVRTWLVGIAADMHLSARPLELSAGLGLASAITAMNGEASELLDAADPTELTAVPLARASLHLPLGSSLRVYLRALIGASVPEVAVRFLDREVASWGRPLIVLSIGLELPVLADTQRQQ